MITFKQFIKIGLFVKSWKAIESDLIFKRNVIGIETLQFSDFFLFSIDIKYLILLIRYS